MVGSPPNLFLILNEEKAESGVSRKYYTLTERAAEDLAALTNWSLIRWGEDLTDKYLEDLHEGTERIAKSYKSLRSRSELAAGTGVSIYPIREHYVIFHPVGKEHIVILALLRQGRDIPNILRANSVRIERELKDIRRNIEQGDLVIE